MDFGFGGKGADNTANSAASTTNADGSPITDLSTGKADTSVNGLPADDINGITHTGNVDDKGKNDKGGNTLTKDANATTTDDVATTDENTDTSLEVGTIIEAGADKYTVDATGNLVNKDGSIFKEAKDVKDWLATFGKIDDGSDKELSIDTIKEVIGIDLVDADNKPIEFENTPTGVKAYIDAVTEANRDTHHEEAIDGLFNQYPFISDILNYYVANGNSLEGFGEVQDRSGITIDDTNEAQHENIIRTAWKEQNRRGNVEQYIAYLKSSNTLLPVAKDELKGLQDSDTEIKQERANQAALKEQTRIQNLEAYWNNVKETINSKTIAGYQIPDVITINKDGIKKSATPSDFYNYLYQTDQKGKSAYENELSKRDPKEKANDELLRAYLRFTGGSYSDLVNMAVNKEKVKVLKLQSNQKPASSIKVTKPKADASKGGIDFGYN